MRNFFPLLRPYFGVCLSTKRGTRPPGAPLLLRFGRRLALKPGLFDHQGQETAFASHNTRHAVETRGKNTQVIQKNRRVIDMVGLVEH